MINWLHTNIPNSIAWQIGPFSIHWYGLMIALGMGLGIALAVYLGKKLGVNATQYLDIVFYSLIIGLVCDRLYYVIYDWSYFRDHLIEIPMFWQGGLAIYGALIGGAGTVWYFSRKFKIDFWLLGDISLVAVSIGLMFGRWGNYFNQELFGLPTDLPWGIPIDPKFRPGEFINSAYFHPAFIYESILMFVISAILTGINLLRTKIKFPSGLATALFFTFYGGVRIFTEQLRIDYSPYFFGQRVNFWGAIIILMIGLVMVAYRTIYLAKVRKNDATRTGSN